MDSESTVAGTTAHTTNLDLLESHGDTIGTLTGVLKMNPINKSNNLIMYYFATGQGRFLPCSQWVVLSVVVDDCHNF